MSSNMNGTRRLLSEWWALYRVLRPGDFFRFAVQCLTRAPQILRARNLVAVDSAMKSNLAIVYRNRRISLPIAEIDAALAGRGDNPTFGSLREMYARDCYLRRLRLGTPATSVLDLGANRGLFSLIGLIILDAEVVVAVEPQTHYEPVARLLLEANGCGARRAVRYGKFIGSSTAEVRDPDRFVSINRIRAEQRITRFDFAKIDVEGAERDLFGEPNWLPYVDNIAMELHHRLATGLDSIPQALDRQGFDYLTTDQFGRECPFREGAFLYASRTGALINSARP